jgi:hypothetical protein
MTEIKSTPLQLPASGLIAVLGLVAMAILAACGGDPSDGPSGAAAGGPEGAEAEPTRIVAIGDLHGDLEAARGALRLAGAIDEFDEWIGGDMIVVQTGDILDRGDDEEAIMDLFGKLKEQAEESGGAVHVLNGNHELMNAYLDFRYVTQGGFEDFPMEDPEGSVLDSVLAELEPEHRSRGAAFRPGGPVALRMAEQPIAVIVDKTLFTHAGILPAHVDMGLSSMEASVSSWLRGEAPQPEWIRGDISPVWNRVYSGEPSVEACDTLDIVLERLELDRMVVGHTVQESGITAYCGGRLWCIDVGLASHYGGRPEVLEIRGSRVRSLRSAPPSF